MVKGLWKWVCLIISIIQKKKGGGMNVLCAVKSHRKIYATMFKDAPIDLSSSSSSLTNIESMYTDSSE